MGARIEGAGTPRITVEGVSRLHGARHDVKCVLHTHTNAGMAVSVLKCGLLPLTQTAMRWGKIAYHEKLNKQEIVDKRKHKRLVPNNPLSTLILADGSSQRCFVIDMSVSGAAVSAEILPEVGMPLAVGKIVGRVVRHINGGFAVKFVETQGLNMLERMIIQPPK